MNTFKETLFSLKKSNYLLNESAQILNDCVVNNNEIDERLRNSIKFALGIINLASYCLKNEQEQLDHELNHGNEAPWEFSFNEAEQLIECTVKNNFGNEKLVDLIFHIGDAMETYRTTNIKFRVPKSYYDAKQQIRKVIKN
ncbi:MPN534 family protein [Mycoplasmoides pneumoniae]|uniref:Uncharacterized protein MPN_534 n=4 Tax=Mycoplasmoides pneumoniae TaxID=2104 RepID=Y534_MYCPN|nr:hypothetical protein [Mycoplasmoides pneumoniae]P75244.1 RecName: Full=Uncharacterized protein MPN_534 [Mycoplasmoides pneumoniae M129]AAB95956.1 conserved hypothetical protein [Mycoplasmoides pneumoniae M129]ADK86836.1 conserved hypothetical protein [Mycoplasmoides pneumoniae FH]AGC04420.1 hypothetical protein C985_0544 [Mycoplasmoides pneumoniae M129-B7]ALA30410.1 hypothetical protein C897_03075 [Mycoplasmoides pneumoniae PI 1428]ALA30696.1 hypothetical protein B434_00700 [Mycoplasmoides